MTDTQDSTEPRVSLRVDISKEVDHALELEKVHRDCTKWEIVEDALRAYLKLQKRKAA